MSEHQASCHSCTQAFPFHCPAERWLSLSWTSGCSAMPAQKNQHKALLCTRDLHMYHISRQLQKRGNLWYGCVAASLSGGCVTYISTMNNTCSFFCLLLLHTVQAIYSFSSIRHSTIFQSNNHNLCTSSLLFLLKLKDSVKDYTWKMGTCLLPLLLSSNMMCLFLYIPHFHFSSCQVSFGMCFKVPSVLFFFLYLADILLITTVCFSLWRHFSWFSLFRMSVEV